MTGTEHSPYCARVLIHPSTRRSFEYVTKRTSDCSRGSSEKYCLYICAGNKDTENHVSTINSCIVVPDSVLTSMLHTILFAAVGVLVMYKTVSSGTSISRMFCVRLERHTLAKCPILQHDLQVLFRAGHCLEFVK